MKNMHADVGVYSVKTLVKRENHWTASNDILKVCYLNQLNIVWQTYRMKKCHLSSSVSNEAKHTKVII